MFFLFGFFHCQSKYICVSKCAAVCVCWNCKQVRFIYKHFGFLAIASFINARHASSAWWAMGNGRVEIAKDPRKMPERCSGWREKTDRQDAKQVASSASQGDDGLQLQCGVCERERPWEKGNRREQAISRKRLSRQCQLCTVVQKQQFRGNWWDSV